MTPGEGVEKGVSSENAKKKKKKKGRCDKREKLQKEGPRWVAGTPKKGKKRYAIEEGGDREREDHGGKKNGPHGGGKGKRTGKEMAF